MTDESLEMPETRSPDIVPAGAPRLPLSAVVDRVTETARRRSEEASPCVRCGERPGWEWNRGECAECWSLCRRCHKDQRYSGRELCARCDAGHRFAVGIPPKFSEATLDQVRDLQPAAVMSPIDRWLSLDDVPASAGLVFTGPVGCGKTHAAAAVLRQLLEDSPGDSFVFTSTADMLQALRPGREGIERYQRSDWLVLDDLGRERLDTEWAAETLFLVVDHRWRNKKPIIATTNLEPKFLAALVGEAVVDRLLDGAVGVRFAGQSLRRMAS